MTTPLLLLQDATTRQPEMTTGSWVFMLVAWTFVTALLVWSFVRVLSDPK